MTSPLFFFFFLVFIELQGSTSCTPAAVLVVVKVHALVEHWMFKWAHYSASSGSYNAGNDFFSWCFRCFVSGMACGF